MEKIHRFGSVQEAAEAVLQGIVDVGFCVNANHDRGNWYVAVMVVCAPQAAPLVERVGFARTTNGHEVSLPLFGASYLVPFRLGPTPAATPEQVAKEAACLRGPGHHVDHRARLVSQALTNAMA